MSKLHELLAVRQTLHNRFAQQHARTTKLLQEGLGVFIGHTKRYKPLDEEGVVQPPQDKQVGTTVEGALNEYLARFEPYVDAEVQIEVSNTEARADVMLGEKVILQDVPATALLNLEKRLEALRAVIARLPVLDPAYKWEQDPEVGYYRSPPTDTLRTEKVRQSFVAYEATPDHPAQVEVFTEDVPVGTWTTVNLSGEIPATEKQELLTRCDELILAVQTARKRANDTEHSRRKVASRLTAYILHGETLQS